MASMLPGDPSQHGMVESSPFRVSQDEQEEAKQHGGGWYFGRKEIEENSPSRRDGIDLKKETYLRKSYCTFLQDLGMRLKVPQVTIATAIVFCHRFFLRQSHAKNDRRTVATVCMFLAGKVEETPRPLKDVILVSYEIIHKKDPAAIQRIKQREVYEQQKELILLGERLVLVTLGFDLNMHHPYKPLVEAIKKFKVAQNALAQVAWNFVNDGLRTSLCLQFKPHHIAAGAIFLAAKFLKVKLPSDGEKVWWQEFDVTPRQLEEVSNQMLELYEQNRVATQSQGNETEGPASVANQRAPAEVEDPATQNVHSQSPMVAIAQCDVPTTTSARTIPEQVFPDKQNGIHSTRSNEAIDYKRYEPGTIVSDNKAATLIKEHRHKEPGNHGETSGSMSYDDLEHSDKEKAVYVTEGTSDAREKNSFHNEGSKGYSPMVDAIKKIDKVKVKAALEKRRRARGEVAKKVDLMDEDDLIERELEHGIELAVEDERNKQEKTHNWSSHKKEHQNMDRVTDNGYHGTEKLMSNTEEGELSLDSQEFQSPEPSSHKRKSSSPGKHFVGKDGHDLPHYHTSSSKHRDNYDDLRHMGRFEHAERDHKRLRHENQV